MSAPTAYHSSQVSADLIWEVARMCPLNHPCFHGASQETSNDEEDDMMEKEELELMNIAI
jgi:hypothetical protein